MNPRIKELIEKATHTCGPTAYNPLTFEVFDKEKFAESLIRECMKIATGLSELYTRDDVGFDVGYTMGTKRVAKEIAKSFGIEE
jgi:hypothetical protein